MPNVPFPDRIDPFKLFNKNGHIASKIPLTAFKRFGEYLQEDSGQIDVVIDFFKDDEGRRVLQGKLTSEVVLLCQRCLDPVSTVVESELNIIVASSESGMKSGKDSGKAPDDASIEQSIEQQDARSGVEVIFCDEDALDLKAVIEDELILSLPIVVYHDNVSCNEQLNQVKQDANEQGLTLDADVKSELIALKEALKKKD